MEPPGPSRGRDRGSGVVERGDQLGHVGAGPGELDGEMREAYEVVLAAQQAGLDSIRAGASGFDVDAAARDVIEASAFAGTFGHGLGHGLGLDVHESPRLSTESSDEGTPESCSAGTPKPSR